MTALALVLGALVLAIGALLVLGLCRAAGRPAPVPPCWAHRNDEERKAS